MKETRRQEGITLVALVITVIVLIILAGVTLSTLVGDNGIISKAQEGKQNMTNAAAEEEEYLQNIANAMNEIEGGNVEQIVDEEGPIVEIQEKEIGVDSITIEVLATDEESGLAEEETYEYYLGEEKQETSEENSYTYTGLESNTEYEITVKVRDKLGNVGEQTKTIKTDKKIATNINEVVEGDYIWYTDAYGTQQKCIVLYGPENSNYSSYGIQIITADIVGNITLGSSDFNTSRNSYNSAIATLNAEAEKYRKKDDGIAEIARCVGSVPNNPNYDGAGMFTSSYSYMSGVNGTLKDTDNNYTADWNQMQSIVIDGQGIHNIGKYYWLASRFVNAGSYISYFYVRNVISSGNLYNSGLCGVRSGGSTYGYSDDNGLRLVFHLKSGIKVTGGDGSEGNPYTLAP